MNGVSLESKPDMSDELEDGTEKKLDQALLKANASFEKAVYAVLRDVGRTPRKHLKSFETLTVLEQKHAEADVKYGACKLKHQAYLSDCKDKILVAKARISVVNQRIIQTQFEMVKLGFQSAVEVSTDSYQPSRLSKN